MGIHSLFPAVSSKPRENKWSTISHAPLSLQQYQPGSSATTVKEAESRLAQEEEGGRTNRLEQRSERFH